MDVPESSKHGKKSTSQKLEDQKKVGKSSVFILPSLLSNALLFIFSCCVCVCMRAAFFFFNKRRFALASAGFQLQMHVEAKGMKVCLSPGLLFSLLEGEHVGPIATVVWIPSSSCAPYLLIAIYKETRGWGEKVEFVLPLSVFSLSSWHMWRGSGHGPPQPPPTGNTYLLSVWDAFCVNHSGNRKEIIPVKMRQIVLL